MLKRLHWLRESVSHTTRPPRPGEVDGRDYFFVDRPTFERMIKEGRFLEWAEVHGHLYGSSLDGLREAPEGKGILFEVDCKGAEQIRRAVEDVLLVFIMTPSFADLVERIVGRGGMDGDELGRRIRTAERELQQVEKFDYLVINDRFSRAADELEAILVAETCRCRYRLSSWRKRWMEEMRRGDHERLP